jgi:hypothetical protein
VQPFTKSVRLSFICEVAIVMIHWSSRIVFAAGLRHPLGVLLLLGVTLSTRIANASTNPVLLPIEILGANGTTASRTVELQVAQAEAVRSPWLHRRHGMSYKWFSTAGTINTEIGNRSIGYI